VGGLTDGWIDRWVEVKAVLYIAEAIKNQHLNSLNYSNL
jgi:hypothetical protein